MSRAPRPAGWRPPRDGVPHGGGVRGRDEQLDAVLAGVARPAHEHVRRAGDGEHAVRKRGGQLAVGERAHDRARLRALDGEHGVVGEPVAHRRVVAARVLLEPREVALVVRRVRHGEEAVRAEPVGEQVVEHPAVLAAQDGVLGAALARAGDVVGEQALEQRLRAGTRRLDLAHVRDVEDPRGSRTARCSSRMPAYWTGISQPANGTSRAPAATWRSYRGVRFSVSVPAAIACRTLSAGPGRSAARRVRGRS